jgi:hypothetical protein
MKFIFYIQWMEQQFPACDAAANEFTVSSESVRIICEYPQKLSTYVDKPVDNTIFTGSTQGEIGKRT